MIRDGYIQNLETSVFELLKRKQELGERGFTMIELTVVVLIVAILIAIAIPTFLGVRSRAQNRAAQSNIRNEIAAAKAIFADTNSYGADTAALVTALTLAEPSLTHQAVGTTSANPKQMEIRLVDSTTLCAQTRSDSGNFYGLRSMEVAGGGQFFLSNDAHVDMTAAATCGISGAAF